LVKRLIFSNLVVHYNTKFMNRISEALDQYTGICKEAIVGSAAKLSKSFEKVIIEIVKSIFSPAFSLLDSFTELVDGFLLTLNPILRKCVSQNLQF